MKLFLVHCVVACLVAAACAVPFYGPSQQYQQNPNSQQQNWQQNPAQNQQWNQQRSQQPQRPQPWNPAQNREQQQQQSGNSLSNSQRPRDWLSPYELENLPAMNEITWQQLENASPLDGAELINKMYHLSKVSSDQSPNYVPEPSQMPATIVSGDGQKVQANLENLVATAKQLENFGNDEVTIFITGYPEQTPSIRKANKKLMQAYAERYSAQCQQQSAQQQNQQQKQQQRRQRQQQGQLGQRDYDYNNQDSDESNEKENPSNERSQQEKDQQNPQNKKQQQYTCGSLVVIDMGATLDSFNRYAKLDVEKTGENIARAIVQMTNEANVPLEMIHIVAQGIAAHVAGVTGREFSRLTGHKLRRITALDPSRIFAKNPNVLTALGTGDADFVDAIHTSSYGMGSPMRVGDADFYPNGPSMYMPGSDNVIEAAMRATRYFAESVRPGNERNFPAATGVSMQQYKTKEGYAKRAYMGIAAEYDIKGDFMLQVNAKSPFGRSATPQRPAHHSHQPRNQNEQ